jgi:cardiolipin synthase
MIWIIIGLLVFIFQIATILMIEFRHPSKSVAWILVLFILPLIGFVMYYFMAKEYKHRKRVKRTDKRLKREDWNHYIDNSHIVRDVHEIRNPDIHDEFRLFGLLQNIPASPITKCNQTMIYRDGPETFKAMFELLRQAKHHIHMEYYILRSDHMGQELQDILIEKAKQGVEVRFLYDGVGGYHLPSSYLKRFRDGGIDCRSFLSPFIAFFDKRMNYRNHRKITVVDGKVGFLGGLNIGDEYVGKNPKYGYWRDTHMQIRGDAVHFLQRTFLTDWAFVSGEQLFQREELFPEHDCAGEEQVQIVASGPDNQLETILEVYFSSLSTAKYQIYITSPYFIPDHSIYMALKTAAVSGVDVRIIIPKVPDSRLVHNASLSYLEELMRAGVKFYCYTRGFIHAKVLIVDQRLASLGTANMDMRSFFSNFELNALMFDTQTIDRLKSDFMNDIKDSEPINYNEFESRSRLQKGKEVISRLLSPLL